MAPSTKGERIKPLKDCVITLSGDQGEGREERKYEGWIKNAGGTYAAHLTEDTTHLVVSDEHWARKSSKVLKALEEYEEVAIVTTEWLDYGLQSKKACADKPVPRKFNLRKQYTNADKEKAKAAEKARKDEVKKDRERKRAEKEAEKSLKRPRKNTMLGALQESTKSFIGPPSKKAKTKSSMGLLAGGLLPQPKLPPRDAAAAAAISRQDFCASKAKLEILSEEDHHFYNDVSGFAYDIVLTKVQTEFNLNQRVELRMFESNFTPHTYTVAEKKSGYKADGKPTAVCASGTNFPTALHTWRNRFEYYTTKKWDQRFEFENLRHLSTSRSYSSKNTGFVTPAQIAAAGGARHTMAGRAPKLMSLEQEKAFLAQRFEYKNPPVGQPQGEAAYSPGTPSVEPASSRTPTSVSPAAFQTTAEPDHQFAGAMLAMNTAAHLPHDFTSTSVPEVTVTTSKAKDAPSAASPGFVLMEDLGFSLGKSIFPKIKPAQTTRSTAQQATKIPDDFGSVIDEDTPMDDAIADQAMDRLDSGAVDSNAEVAEVDVHMADSVCAAAQAAVPEEDRATSAPDTMMSSPSSAKAVIMSAVDDGATTKVMETLVLSVEDSEKATRIGSELMQVKNVPEAIAAPAVTMLAKEGDLTALQTLGTNDPVPDQADEAKVDENIAIECATSDDGANVATNAEETSTSMANTAISESKPVTTDEAVGLAHDQAKEETSATAEGGVAGDSPALVDKRDRHLLTIGNSSNESEGTETAEVAGSQVSQAQPGHDETQQAFDAVASASAEAHDIANTQNGTITEKSTADAVNAAGMDSDKAVVNATDTSTEIDDLHKQDQAPAATMCGERDAPTSEEHQSSGEKTARDIGGDAVAGAA